MKGCLLCGYTGYISSGVMSIEDDYITSIDIGDYFSSADDGNISS